MCQLRDHHHRGCDGACFRLQTEPRHHLSGRSRGPWSRSAHVKLRPPSQPESRYEAETVDRDAREPCAIELNDIAFVSHSRPPSPTSDCVFCDEERRVVREPGYERTARRCRFLVRNGEYDSWRECM